MTPKQSKELRTTHYTATDLKESRNWTESLIKKHAGEPEYTNEFIYKGSPATARYWPKDKIESIEAQLVFVEAMHKRMQRKQSTEKAVDTKTKKLIIWAQITSIHIESTKNYLKRAIEHYNSRNSDGDASLNSDREFLDRISVNYIRHCLTTYENILDDASGRVGVDEAYKIIKNRVLTRIAEMHPELSRECRRQKV